MPMVTVQIPYRHVYEGQVYIPDTDLDNVAGFLSDNEDVLEQFLDNAYTINDQLLVLDAQLSD
jgi:hypothetical protein